MTSDPDLTTHAGARYWEDPTSLPHRFREYAGGAPPPTYDVVDLMLEDLRPMLGFIEGRPPTAEDRLAGFVRLDEDGKPYGLSRFGRTRLLVEVAERIRADFLAAADAEWKATARHSSNGTTRYVERAEDARAREAAAAMRAVRDTLARQGRASGVLLANLRDVLALPGGEEDAEDAARAWLTDLPRERLRRAAVVSRYRDSGAPGGYGRNELLALAREVWPGAERRTSAGFVLDLRPLDPDSNSLDDSPEVLAS